MPACVCPRWHIEISQQLNIECRRISFNFVFLAIYFCCVDAEHSFSLFSFSSSSCCSLIARCDGATARTENAVFGYLSQMDESSPPAHHTRYTIQLDSLFASNWFLYFHILDEFLSYIYQIAHIYGPMDTLTYTRKHLEGDEHMHVCLCTHHMPTSNSI